MIVLKMASVGKLNPKTTVFVLVDVQDAFEPVIYQFDKVVENSNKLLKGAEILGVKVIATEQYPQGLGKTVKEIYLPEGVEPIPKVCFSCLGSKEFMTQLEKTKAKSVVLFGIEAHICLLKTALDALDKGFEVHMVEDAISSRTKENNRIGLERMRQAGAFIASTEMVLFQLMHEAGSDKFKEISKLVK